MATYTLDEVIYNCKKNFTGDVSIIKNIDGTISVYTNSSISPQPFILSESCCKVLNTFNQANPSVPLTTPQGYYFDLEQQKCRWAPRPACETPITPIKIVLNPKGNDGSIFDVNGDENCGLKVDFDFLLKLNCETLANAILNGSRVSNTTQSQEIVDLKNLIEEQETKVENITKEINSVAQEFVNLKYSIICEDFPFTNSTKPVESTSNDTTIPLSETQKAPFSKTGFGSIAPMSFAMPTRSVIFCLMEPDGLKIWQKILGPDAYKRFIDGDITSYTTKQVVELYNENEILVKENKAPYIVECETPFGYKTQVKKKLDDLILTQNKNNTVLTESKQKLTDLIPIQGNTNCGDLIDYFENLSVKMMIEVVEDDGTLTPLTQQQIFPIGNSSTIGSGNLYSYLVGHPLDSGFYVCGQPNNTETWATGCTPIYYSELTNTIQPQNTQLNNNVSSCINIKEALLDELFLQSGYQNSEIDLFHDALSPNILDSNWLHFSDIFDSDDFISGATNQKLKLSLVVNNNCGEFCVLIDQITLQRECQDIRETSVFISESPGFNLTKVVDNKKSWLNNTEYDYRDFTITNVLGTNPIRQTEYDVNDDRLVINTKEIDLNMDIASAVEYDVWCYMSENPCLLTGSTCIQVNWTFESVVREFIPMRHMGVYNGKKWFSTTNGIYNLTIYFDGSDWVAAQTSNFVTPPVIWGNITSISSNPSIGLNPPEDGWVSYVNSPFGGGTLYLENNAIDYTNENCCGAITCGDNNIDFSTFLTDNITEVKTIENFEYLMGDFIDVKSRKTLSGYPTLRAIYDRYMNSTKYCDTSSLAFDYHKMDEFSNLITTYWDDLIEQVIPSTTLWGSIKVYTNTMFDQQKFKYKSYTTLFCDEPKNRFRPPFIAPSPINGNDGLCQNVEAVLSHLPILSSSKQSVVTNTTTTLYNKVCLSQMNWGSEFIGNVDIMGPNGKDINSDTFCMPCVPQMIYNNEKFTSLELSNGASFKSDGTVIYISTHNGTPLDNISAYSLYTPWDVSTINLPKIGNSIGFPFGNPSGIYGQYFSPNGENLFFANSSRNGVFKYTLSTPWDVSTSSYSSGNVFSGGTVISPQYLEFSPDGLFMFVTVSGGLLKRYTLTTAWDISSGVVESQSISFGNAFDFTFQNNGYYLFSIVSSSGALNIRKQVLSIPYDLTSIISTETKVISSFIPSGNFYSITFKDGYKGFISGYYPSGLFPRTEVYAFELECEYDIKGSLVINSI